MIGRPLVSVIVPVVPNDIHIHECVSHIKKSSYKNYELLIINENKERSFQRNVGIKNAKGKYLLWLDSDMMISPMLIEDCISQMENQSLIGIYLPEKIITNGWFGRLRNWERQFYTGTAVDVMRFIRLEDCPYFDEALSGPEDADWQRRCPKGLKGICNFSFEHKDDIGIIKYFHKKAYYAKSMGRYKQKNPDDPVLTFKYRCFKVFTENNKWKIFLSHPILALEVIILVLIRGIILWIVK